MQPNKHRTWAEIDLGAIEHNYRVICEAAKAPVLCVVKADCYGHGAVPVANRLQSMGAPYLPEAVELRENGIQKPIIILGYIDAADMDTVAEYGITAPVYDEETAELLSAAAVRTGRDITVHYKLDTGMTRIGFPSWEREETVRRILECAKKPGLRSEGIFTHFAVADVPSGEEYTEMQYDRFRGVCEGLAENGLDLPLRHCANSGAIQSYKQMHCTMTRAGIILYGFDPSDEVRFGLFRPVMKLKTVVSMVKVLQPGQSTSYGRRFTAERPTPVATLCTGYADGYPRQLSCGKGIVEIHGTPCPVLGRVCMDQMMVDLSAVPGTVQEGNEAILWGGTVSDSAEDIARKTDTITYEVLCGVSRRVPRVYLEHGTTAAVEDWILND